LVGLFFPMIMDYLLQSCLNWKFWLSWWIIYYSYGLFTKSHSCIPF
jgi:hypothetical protein